MSKRLEQLEKEWKAALASANPQPYGTSVTRCYVSEEEYQCLVYLSRAIQAERRKIKETKEGQA